MDESSSRGPWLIAVVIRTFDLHPAPALHGRSTERLAAASHNSSTGEARYVTGIADFRPLSTS
jgi:hypothetical protein